MTSPRLCDASQSRLLVIDIQTRLAAAMAGEDRERVITNTGLLLRAARLLKVPIYLSEQYPRGLGATEAEITALLPSTTQRIEKTCFSACRGECHPGGFDFTAADERQIVITGMEAHVCVLQTALTLQSQGLQVYVAGDAVCSRNPANAANALARLSQSGVVVTNTESVIFEWLRDARHEHFKALSTLVR